MVSRSDYPTGASSNSDTRTNRKSNTPPSSDDVPSPAEETIHPKFIADPPTETMNEDVKMNKQKKKKPESSSTTSLASLYKNIVRMEDNEQLPPWIESEPLEDEHEGFDPEFGEQNQNSDVNESLSTFQKLDMQVASENTRADNKNSPSTKGTAVSSTPGTSDKYRQARKGKWCLILFLVGIVLLVAACLLVLGLHWDWGRRQERTTVFSGTEFVTQGPSVSPLLGNPTPNTGGDTPIMSPPQAPPINPVPPPVATSAPINYQPPVAAPAPVPTNSPIALPAPKAPTPFPTRSPTPLPTPVELDNGSGMGDSPIECRNMVNVGESCYTGLGDTVTLEFTMCDPQDGDWIGIYQVGDPGYTVSLGDDYVAWAYTCGGQNCQGAPNKSSLSIDTSFLGFGEFRAFLIPGLEGPYASVAMSDIFMVTQQC